SIALRQPCLSTYKRRCCLVHWWPSSTPRRCSRASTPFWKMPKRSHPCEATSLPHRALQVRLGALLFIITTCCGTIERSPSYYPRGATSRLDSSSLGEESLRPHHLLE